MLSNLLPHIPQPTRPGRLQSRWVRTSATAGLAAGLLLAVGLQAHAGSSPRRANPGASYAGIPLGGESERMPAPARGEPEPPPVDLSIDIRVADVTYLLDPAFPPGLYFGASWVDLDGDGDLDVTVPVDAGPESYLRVWRRTPDGYQDMTAELGLSGITRARAAAWVDLDNDGDLDLYVSRRQNDNPNLLFENRGGRLERVTVDSGLEVDTGGTAASWADFDGDLDLDVLLLGTVLEPLRLMRNDGGFHFSDVTLAWGMDPEFPGIAGAWADYDNDGDADVAIGGAFTFRLYRNDGAAGFHDATGDIFSPRAFLVIPSWADVDSDGDLDLLVGGFNPPRLYENRLEESAGGDVRFFDRTNFWGSGFPFGSGGTWADLDLDGDLDLLDEGGNFASQIYENRINENISGLGLLWTDGESGLPRLGGISWHPAPGDFDDDGRVDFFSPHERFPRLYQNVTPPEGRPLRLRLQPSYGGVAVGAQVRLELEGRIQYREVAWPQAAFSFGSADVVLALEKRGAAPSVTVRWPSGLEESFRGLSAGKLHVLTEGDGKPVRPGGRPPRRPAASRSQGLATDTGLDAPRLPGAVLEVSCNPCRGPVSLTLSTPASRAREIEIFDTRGRLVRRLPVFSGSAEWNLRDRTGRAVAAGVYWLRPADAAQPGTGVRLVVLR